MCILKYKCVLIPKYTFEFEIYFLLILSCVFWNTHFLYKIHICVLKCKCVFNLKKQICILNVYLFYVI